MQCQQICYTKMIWTKQQISYRRLMAVSRINISKLTISEENRGILLLGPLRNSQAQTSLRTGWIPCPPSELYQFLRIANVAYCHSLMRLGTVDSSHLIRKAAFPGAGSSILSSILSRIESEIGSPWVLKGSFPFRQEE